VDHAEEVHLEHRVDVVELLLLEQATGHQAGVVHEQADAVELGDRIAALVDRLARGQVHPRRAHRLRAAGSRVDGLEGLGLAHAGEHQLERPRGQLLGDRAADPAVGARHERDRAGQVHQVKIRRGRIVRS